MRYTQAANGQKAGGSVEEGEGRVGGEQPRLALPPLHAAWMYAMQRDMHKHPYPHRSRAAYAYPPYNRAGAPMLPLKAHLHAPEHKNQLARPAAAAAQRVPQLRVAPARPQPQPRCALWHARSAEAAARLLPLLQRLRSRRSSRS